MEKRIILDWGNEPKVAFAYKVLNNKLPMCCVGGKVMPEDHWSVVVLRCSAESARSVLLGLYDFVEDIEGVRDLHFLIRDRIGKEIVMTFRVLLESRHERVIKSKITFKLGTLLSNDKFAVDPDVKSRFEKYVAWEPEKRIADFGPEKFAVFCGFLGRLSRIVADMLREDYYGSAERVEMARLVSWMLGCTEYGLISPTHWEVGYYDRVEDKASAYLKQNFPREKKPEG
jgi:hypothetical protein